MVATTPQNKPYKGWGMEGLIAKWYAGLTGKNLEPFRKEARDIAKHLPSGADVLEVAPGPGFLAIELAKLGSYHLVGLDISKSFVRMARENATKDGVQVDFREGNASAMPFEANTFDYICCRAAFKNFTEPVQALCEMHRVLKPSGEAVILDLRKDASSLDIKAAVNQMGLNWLNALLTARILRWLQSRAYTPDDFRQLVAQTPFKTCDIKCDLISMVVSLHK